MPLAHDGVPLILIDTAGLRDSDEEVERLGIQRSANEVEHSDLILWLGDDQPPRGLSAMTK